MKKTIVGYQGVKGAYSEIASEKFVNLAKVKNAQIIAHTSFEEIFKNIVDGKIDFGVLPIENSLGGSVYKNFDLLAKYDLEIVLETSLQINHQLLTLPSAKFSDITEVYSHWQGLAQCEINIKKLLPNAKLIEYFDTAGSAEMVAKEKNINIAAIASTKAGEIYGLKVLKKNIQDEVNNLTRFLILAKKNKKSGLEVDKNKLKKKTSIIFTEEKDESGFLFRCLACFYLQKINLTKIESRPIPGKLWQYYFYVDFEGDINDEKVKNTLATLSQNASYLKVLGSYYF